MQIFTLIRFYFSFSATCQFLVRCFQMQQMSLSNTLWHFVPSNRNTLDTMWWDFLNCALHCEWFNSISFFSQTIMITIRTMFGWNLFFLLIMRGSSFFFFFPTKIHKSLFAWEQAKDYLEFNEFQWKHNHLRDKFHVSSSFDRNGKYNKNEIDNNQSHRIFSIFYRR